MNELTSSDLVMLSVQQIAEHLLSEGFPVNMDTLEEAQYEADGMIEFIDSPVHLQVGEFAANTVKELPNGEFLFGETFCNNLGEVERELLLWGVTQNPVPEAGPTN